VAALKRICSGAGCGRAVDADVRYCSACAEERATEGPFVRTHTPGNTDRERYKKLYEGNRWQDGVRPKVLQRDPFCVRCKVRPTQLIDHIVPAGVAVEQVQDSGRYPLDAYAGFYLLSNLQGLCRSCHGYKTLEDKAHTGAWPNVLDKEDAQGKRDWKF
jgi:5-methylcytosine-specific restriction endonuclease McrA